MSFEDDAYWESEYTDRAVARKAVSRPAAPPVDELAARRKRRKSRYRRPPRGDGGVQKGFDTERPSWLDDPDFVPTDVSGPDVAGHDSAVLDFNRPELGAAFDAPGHRWTGRDVHRAEDDDWDDEIDEPFDHRAGMDRRSTVPGLGGYVSSREDWDDPSPEDWDDDLDEPSAGLDDDAFDRYRGQRRDDWPDDTPDDRDGPRALGRATPAAPPRIISQAGPPPMPKPADPQPAPRVLSGRARVTPQPVAPAAATAPPAVGTAPVSPASSAIAPVSSAAVGSAPVSPASAATAPVSSPAVGSAPVSSAAIGTAPVSPPPAAAGSSVSPAVATASSRSPSPPAVLPPAQRAPADDTVSPRPEVLKEPASDWFGTEPRRPAAAETTSSDDGGAVRVQPAPALAPDDLRAVRWRLDGATLREVVDDQEALRELGSRLDGPLAEETDHAARAGLLSLRAEVYRLLGELGMAAAASRLGLAHAESAQNVHAIVIAQAELAHVMRLRGHYAEADRLLEEAASSEAPELLRSVVHEYAGRSCFDQGRHMEALDHFARAIRLGAPDDLDLVERIDVCLEAVYIHVLRDGWGPYPRLRREILRAGLPA
jgi:hypothetical protein